MSSKGEVDGKFEEASVGDGEGECARREGNDGHGRELWDVCRDFEVCGCAGRGVDECVR